MLDTWYCSLLQIHNMVCHWRPYMAILDWRHHLIRQGSLQIRGEAAGSGNPPSLTAETAFYGFKPGWFTGMRIPFNDVQQHSTALFQIFAHDDSVHDRQLTQRIKFHWALGLCWAEMSSNSPNCHGELSGRTDGQMIQSTFNSAWVFVRKEVANVFMYIYIYNILLLQEKQA